MSRHRPALFLPIVLAGVLAAGCSKKPASNDSTPSAPATPAPAAAAPAAAPLAPLPAMPAHQSTQPAPSTPAAEPEGTETRGSGSVATATGRVTETMDAGGYTYVQIDTGTERIWAATAPIKVKVGQMLTVPLEMPMQNFHAAKLGRDFPLIYFASRVARGGEPLPPRPAMPTAEERAAAGQVPPGHPPVGQRMPPGHPQVGQEMPAGHPPVGAGSKSPMTVTEVIPPAAGGVSVADLWAKRTSLAGKTVVVRGKVVKFLGGIMGHNWLHLQDGTGTAKDGTNDITVTTDTDAKPGDIVTATGTLAIDKDFGAGYRYGAIVESATLSKAAGS